MDWRIPESLHAYFTELPVQAGVDALLAKPDKFPPDIQWRELDEYYHAWIAAQRVMTDYSLALNHLWRELWDPLIPLGWTPKEPADQIEYDKDASPHAANCWWHDWLPRCFDRGQFTLYACTSLSGEGATVGFGLFNRRGSTMIRFAVAGFEYERGSDIHWMLEPMPLKDGAICLDSGPPACVVALEAVEKAIRDSSV